jgi:hypothetical protein
MLPNDTSLLGLVGGHAGIGFAFEFGLFNLLRISRKIRDGVPVDWAWLSSASVARLMRLEEPAPSYRKHPAPSILFSER